MKTEYSPCYQHKQILMSTVCRYNKTDKSNTADLPLASTGCVSNYYPLATKNISFKSFRLVTHKDKKNCTQETSLNFEHLYADHETYFFRYPELLSFTTEYLKSHYPEGAVILNPFSSVGEEARSLAMMLNDTKYRIIGIDIISDAVNMAKKGEHTITAEPYRYVYRQGSDCIEINPADAFLLKPCNQLKEVSQRRLHEMFYQYFDIVGRNKEGIIVKVKNGSFENVDFIKGNICEIEDISNNSLNMGSKTVGAVYAQNGFFQVLRNNKDVRNGELILSSVKDCNLDDFRKAIKGIHNILDDNGILVYGALDRDHFTQEDLDKLKDPELIRSLANHNNIYRLSVMHKIIEETGFEPLYYAQCSTPSRQLDSLKIKVPSVYKKKSVKKTNV